MGEFDGLPQQVQEQVRQLGAADVVVGITDSDAASSMSSGLAAARSALATLRPAGRAVLVHADGLPAESGDAGEPHVIVCPLPGAERFSGETRAGGEPYSTLLRISRALGASACGILTSNAENITPQAVHSILEPVLEHGIDLQVSCYARHKFEGLINSGIAYPLTRALYGRRVQCPMSADLAFSKTFVERLPLDAGLVRASASMWFPTFAVVHGLQIGEVHIGARATAPRNPADVSAVISEVLGSLYAAMEENAVFWQRTRGSQPVQTFGKPQVISEGTGVVDVSNMIEAFQLGYRNLLDVWSLFLPPETLVELKRLTRVPTERFAVADELWSRIVYDFGLGYRLRSISRDHLLRAMTPLYLGWVASYALEVRTATGEAAQERVEQLCRAFEAQKPYLVSRWRWPDRSNR